ncbi:4Fe-4S single cluster domain-containing protein [Paenibacillus campinasensis]|uniref:Anaerobic ribonucleoside-triphosphate reductase-activating protein n=1 Tax=Paenibacillus campinasensis TaxID=66347 RepID=A0A268EIB5_9BACL|nr:4Fe-4S single cluster domain-containing protein [Paenibacillus campinasensis]PAD72870.1 anaerobic ribonucleoside-triphosphate reductase activating protein [Paenibacillus campinasensis]
MRIHSFTPSTFVNGPGNRAMIHTQGCTLACPGCFNNSTHSKDGGKEVSVPDLIQRIPADVDGVTISGGEPFLQPEDLLELVTELRERVDSIVVFSGFYLREIQKMPLGQKILGQIDVLIDGRFEIENIAQNGVRGSENQTIHLLTERHCREEFEERNVEIIIDNEGKLIMTGFPPEEIRQGIGSLT